MQIAEGMGEVFFWAALFVIVCLGVYRLIKWLRRIRISFIDMVGELILFGLFVMPAITIGAYIGSIIDNALSMEGGLNIAFLFAGFLAGAYLWRRALGQ